MKIMNIYYSSHFLRQIKRLGKKYRDIVFEREKIFRSDCFDPRLRTHKLHGRLRGYWSFSLTHSHRVLFEFIDKHTVGFIDVGDHSVYS